MYLLMKWETEMPATYCNYRGVCGFDRKVPGYEFRRMKQFADDEIWKIMEGEAD